MTPNSVASARGTRMPAQVAPAPESMCWFTICRGSMRYT